MEFVYAVFENRWVYQKAFDNFLPAWAAIDSRVEEKEQ